MKLIVHLCQLLMCLLICGCVAVQPRPHRFTDTTEKPISYHAAWSHQDKLILDIVPHGNGGAFYGMEVFNEGGNLYVFPFYENIFPLFIPISTVHSKLHMERQCLVEGTNQIDRFTIDPAQFGLKQDWPAHIYWMAYPDMYPFPTGGFWSEKHRHPTVRRRLEVLPLSPDPTLRPAAAMGG